MSEIAKCRLCGAKPLRSGGGWWLCSTPNCCVAGPNDDPDGAKWNRLMRAMPTEPRAGRTGMNGLLKRALAEPRWVNDVVLGAEVMRTTGCAFCDADLARIGARVREIVEPTEIPGAVEASDD